MSYSTKIFLISLIVCLGLGMSLVVLAQEETTTEIDEEIIKEINLDEEVSAEDLEVKEPKLLPDSRFYFLKNWGRGIRSFFTFNKVKKTELESRFANERLIEIRKMIEEGKDKEEIKKAIEEYKKTVDKVRTRAEKIKQKAEENPQVEKFLEKYTHQQILHQKVLEKLENQVPEETFQRIKEARERHLERFGQVMIKLEDRKEKIEETLENALEKVKGSKYKNFKNLEVLMKLEEKVPEQAKEAIRGAQENALKRLQGDLEKMSPQDQERFKEYLERISGDKEKQAEILERVRQKIQNQEQLKEKLMEAEERVLERARIKEREHEQSGTSACIALWDPVCGKDGKTYSNECFAKAAGVEVDYKGKCRVKEKCIKKGTDTGLTLAEAKKIALSSECVQQGELTATSMYNEDTGTWWINLEPSEKKAGCNPACVVNVVTQEAKINWRCTGLIEPSDCALKCKSYRYSTCPEGCIKRCVSSTCRGDICTSDCEGPGSCLCQ